MKREEFNALVTRLEGEASADPQKYRKRVLGLAILGYAYVFFVLAALLALLTVMVIITIRSHTYGLAKLDIILLIITFTVLRSLWVKMHPPEGIQLSPQNAGPLFSAIDEIRSKLDAPAPHHILLTDDFNAAAAQVPRLGLFGWHKRYLILGLPFMQAVTPDQLRAVIAHEFGHLSGNHSRFAGWIYRVRQTWGQLMDAFEQQGRGSWLFSKFFDWYAPYFMAYSFVLARANEYVADRCAAEAVGSRAAADALVRTHIAGSLLEEKFWPTIFRRASEQATPPPALYADMGETFRAPVEAQLVDKWFTRALREKSDTLDTHPSLTERLRALKEEAHEVPPAPNTSEETAAAYFLGESLPQLTQQMNERWEKSITATWRERHEHLQKSRETLAELAAKEDGGETLLVEEAWQRAELIEELEDEATALPHYKAVLNIKADYAPAHFAIGRILLAQDDASGIQSLETAMSAEPMAVPVGCQLIYTFLVANGEEERAKDYYQRALQQSDKLDEAQVERSGLSAKDKLVHHGLGEEELAPLREQLVSNAQISAAYLVRKEVEHFAEKPLYVLGIVAAKAWYKFENEDFQARLCASFAEELKFEGECFVVPLSSQNAALKKAVLKVEDCKIFSR